MTASGGTLIASVETRRTTAAATKSPAAPQRRRAGRLRMANRPARSRTACQRFGRVTPLSAESRKDGIENPRWARWQPSPIGRPPRARQFGVPPKKDFSALKALYQRTGYGSEMPVNRGILGLRGARRIIKMGTEQVSNFHPQPVDPESANGYTDATLTVGGRPLPRFSCAPA